MNDPRINLDSNLRRWFARTLGLWRSRRQYLFDNDEVFHVDMVIRVEMFAELEDGNTRYRFSWWPEKDSDLFVKKPRYQRQGVIEATLWGHKLLRSKAYLDDSPVTTSIRQVDEHESIFESHYENWDILEHARLIDQDRYRSRAIYSWADGELKIMEHHHEIRLEEASKPIEE